MGIISYAQNFEDVILWRALKDIKVGFYVDVGAYDPEIDSVTKAFYDNGWRGINIEPIPEQFEKFIKERTRDINLQVCVGKEKREVTIYHIPDTGLSTLNKEIAYKHREERGYNITEQTVAMRTLTDICQEFHVAPIHFMKIDVEGSEREVIEGLDLDMIRPWIIVVEATLPNTQIDTSKDWEHLICTKGYIPVYFDGLNRFYLAEERRYLKKFFKSPPNVFDGFVLSENSLFCNLIKSKYEYSLNQLNQSFEDLKEKYKNIMDEYESLRTNHQILKKNYEDKMSELESLNQSFEDLKEHYDHLKQEHISSVSELNHLKEEYNRLNNEYASLRVAYERLAADLNSVLNSRSWRYTKPVRLLFKFFREIKNKAVDRMSKSHRMKIFVKKVIGDSMFEKLKTILKPPQHQDGISGITNSNYKIVDIKSIDIAIKEAIKQKNNL